MVWLCVLVALLVDVLTPMFIVVSCALADTLSTEAEDFCGSIIPYIPLAGIAIAMAGAVVSRRQRRDEPWIAGVVVALLLAGVPWMLVREARLSRRAAGRADR